MDAAAGVRRRALPLAEPATRRTPATSGGRPIVASRSRRWRFPVPGGPAIGIVIALLALVPASAWLGLFGMPASPLLLRGILLLRVALVVTGVFVALGSLADLWTDAPRSRSTRPATADASLGGLRDPALLGLLIAATVLRLIRLDAGMWVDEVSTLVEYGQHSLGYIVSTYATNNQHPLFSVLARVAIVIFGEHTWSLRLPSVLFGVGSVWGVYALGRVVASRREALLAAALLTFSYQGVWFSQNARGYAGLLFWSLLSSWLLLRGLREPGTRRVWLWFAIAVALGMYTHLTMLFVVMAQCLVYAWWVVTGGGHGAGRGARARRLGEPTTAPWVPFVSGFVLAGLLTILLYAPVLPQIPEASAGDLSNVATWRSPLWMITETVRGMQLGALGIVVVAAGLAIVLMGCGSYLRREPAIPVLFVASVGLGGGVMLALGHHLWPRFFFYAVGFALLVVVRGVFVAAALGGRLLRWTPERAELLATLGLVAVTAFGARSLQWVYRPKQDFGGALAYIAQQQQPGDAMVSAGVAAIAMRQYYAPDWPTVKSADDLRTVMNASPRTWMVYTLPIEMEQAHAEVLAIVRSEFREMRVFEGSLGGGAVIVALATRVPGPPAGGEVQTPSDDEAEPGATAPEEPLPDGVPDRVVAMAAPATGAR
jgi:mannosyltransferase